MPAGAAGWHLAQANIGRLVAAPDDPRVAEFFAALDAVNALAEATPGFVWRLKDETGNAMSIGPTPDPRVALNMSVWTGAEALFEFVYRSGHTPVMARRREWFERWDGAYQVLWWIEAGTIPTVEDALARLWLLDRYGPCERAFTFKSRFPAPGLGGSPVDHQPDPWCVGTA